MDDNVPPEQVGNFLSYLQGITKKMDSPYDLLDVCKKFIDDNDIYSAEKIYQCDPIIENAYELIEKICDIVGYKVYKED